MFSSAAKTFVEHLRRSAQVLSPHAHGDGDVRDGDGAGGPASPGSSKPA